LEENVNKLSRRTFGKRILAASAVPLLRLEPLPGQTETTPSPIVPDAIAGYKLTAEDKQLAVKFLSTHEKNMSALREKDLLNSLAPNFIFASPTTNEKRPSR